MPTYDVIYTKTATPGRTQAYVFDTSTGYGTRYSDPSSEIEGSSTGLALTSDASMVAVSCAATPFQALYAYTPGSGFGTRFSNPGTALWDTDGWGGGNVHIAPSDGAIAFGGLLTPFIRALELSPSGYGSYYSAPASVVANYGRCPRWNRAGTALLLAHDGAPRLSGWPWSDSTGFGTRYSDPASPPSTGDPGSSGGRMAFSRADNSVITTEFGTPYVAAFAFSSSTGFGTRFSNPGTLPAGRGNAFDFSVSGGHVVVSHNTAPCMSVYEWSDSTGFGTKLSNPAETLATLSNDVAFSPGGEVCNIQNFNTGRLATYVWSDSTGLGTRFAAPSPDPGASSAIARFTPAYTPSGGGGGGVVRPVDSVFNFGVGVWGL